MKNLLFVDDDIHLTSMIISDLKKLLGSQEYAFFSAINGQEALQLLKTKQIDFVVTDLKMPVMNGLELLAHIHSRFSAIPVIVLTSYSSDGIEERLRKLGCLKLFTKPVHVVKLADAIKELMNETEVGGIIKNISVGGFLQLIEMEGKTCQVNVSNKNTLVTGWFQFDNGILLDSGCGDIRGEPAAQEIISWDRVEIKVNCKKNHNEIPKRTISNTLITLLLNNGSEHFASDYASAAAVFNSSS